MVPTAGTMVTATTSMVSRSTRSQAVVVRPAARAPVGSKPVNTRGRAPARSTVDTAASATAVVSRLWVLTVRMGPTRNADKSRLNPFWVATSTASANPADSSTPVAAAAF
jgi:hypothetical protein